MEQELAYSFHLGSDKNKSKLAKKVAKENVSGTTSLANNAIQNAKDLSDVNKHNLRDYDNQTELIRTIYGTNDIVNDVNLDVENHQVDVNLEGLSLDEEVEFMNGKKFAERAYHQQASNTSKQSSYKQAYTERTTKTSEKNASFFSLLKKVLKSIFKPKNTETHSDEVIYPHKTHKDFENEISMDGTLKNLDPTEILQSAKKDSAENTRKPRTTDMSR